MAGGLAVRPLAPVRSTERPAGEVIPATRWECAGRVPAGEGPSRLAAARLPKEVELRSIFLLFWTTSAQAKASNLQVRRTSSRRSLWVNRCEILLPDIVHGAVHRAHREFLEVKQQIPTQR